MALKGSFVLPTARTMIIATVSPSSKDTEHSVNTLKHACIMDLKEGSARGRGGRKGSGGATGVTGVTGTTGATGATNGGGGGGARAKKIGGTRSWTEDIGRINVSKEARILKAKGTGSLQSNGNDGVQKDQHRVEPLSAKEIRRQRISAERTSLKNLTKEQKSLLMEARRCLGANSNSGAQTRRLQRFISPYPQSETQKQERAEIAARMAGRVAPKLATKTRAAQSPTRAANQRQQHQGVYTQGDVEELYEAMSKPDLPSGVKRRLQLKLSKALAYLSTIEDGGDGGDGDGGDSREEEIPPPTSPFKTAFYGGLPEKSKRQQEQQSQPQSQQQQQHFQENMQPSSPQASRTLASLTPPELRGRARNQSQRQSNVMVKKVIQKKKKDRGEAIREARKKIIEEEQRNLQAKTKRGFVDSSFGRLETQLADPSISAAAKVGIKKQLAKLKAVEIREKRKREQGEREALRRKKADEKRTAETRARSTTPFDDGEEGSHSVAAGSNNNQRNVASQRYAARGSSGGGGGSQSSQRRSQSPSKRELQQQYQQLQQHQQYQQPPVQQYQQHQQQQQPYQQPYQQQQQQQQQPYQQQQQQHQQQYQQQPHQHQQPQHQQQPRQHQQQYGHPYQDSLGKLVEDRQAPMDDRTVYPSYPQRGNSVASSSPFATEANYDQMYTGGERSHTRVIN